jgi:hypothetical protein
MQRKDIQPIKKTRNLHRVYDSGAERARAIELDSSQKAGEIKDLREQTVVHLETGINYKTDFDYLEKGRRVFEDVKGPMSERFRMLCHLWKIHGPGPLRILKRAGVGRPFRVTRTIYGGGTPA